MNLLFYQPYNQTTLYIESLVEQFANKGDSTFFLSHEKKGATHNNMEKWGTKTYSSSIKSNVRVIYYLSRINELVKICKVNKIDVVYSHYQEANIIAVLAQYFCKANFIITRHHTDCAFIDNNWKEKLADKIINRLAKTQIAPSRKVLSHMVTKENANIDKIELINYGYNFNAIVSPNIKSVEELRKKYDADLILLSAARFIPEKRHLLLIEEVYKLVALNSNIKLLLLGRGPLETEIKKHINKLGLENNILCIGFKENIMDYYAAADVIVHFSESEASNSAIKEASLTNTPVIVCNDVGDFDDYIIHGHNGFVMDKNNPSKSFSMIINKILKGEFDLTLIGSQLGQDVKNKFDIKNVFNQYLQFSSESL